MAQKRIARHWIAGEWSSAGQEKESLNPATGQIIGTYFDAPLGTAQAAIDAASTAFKTTNWRAHSMVRATALNALAEAFAKRTNEVVESLCLENGKLRAEAAFEAMAIPKSLRFAAGLATQIFGRVIDPLPGVQSMSIRQPVGVAGLIIPWNSPSYLCIRSLAPAMASGCASVVKMPSKAAQTSAVLCDIFSSVSEIPKGIVNFFIESGADGAELLVSSPKVPTLSFTGSTKTGKLIAQAAGAELKRVGLELGGKTPHLVFEDVDLEAVLPVIVKSLTVFSGQFCMTGSRVLVHKSISERFKEELSERLSSVRLGSAADLTSDMGPLIDKASVSRIDKEVEEAIQGGAKVLVRGGPAIDPTLKDGAFYHPTLLEVHDSLLPIVQNEVFGPVQTLQTFESEAEAIQLANDTMYGLSACVWTKNSERQIRVSRQLEAGLISINSWANLQMEFEEGGFKSSGLGRLGGVASLDDFLEYKQISQAYTPQH